jgi:glycerol-3-phosphate acyltransferase PlsX
MVVAIDVMGGDFGPVVTVPAALLALQKHANLQLILIGDSTSIEEALKQQKNVVDRQRFQIHHTTETVAMDESPSHALRTKKDSSMRVAVNLVKENIAQACVSAGNTGALMATGHFVLKTLPGIDRPAIMAVIPTKDPTKKVRMLDLGANVDSSADNLYQFAVMGAVVTTAIDNINAPRVALLNIGEEEIKGNDQVKRTAQLLSENAAINFVGYIEGDDIFSGDVDVVVCDGFVGNVALKSVEGVISLLTHNLRQAFMRNWFTKLVAVLAKPILRRAMKVIDPSRYNGASLLGLQGIVIKSHGGANIAGFANAIEQAVLQVAQNIPERIHQQVGIVLEESKQTGSS